VVKKIGQDLNIPAIDIEKVIEKKIDKRKGRR
jgi:hypothetical protein